MQRHDSGLTQDFIGCRKYILSHDSEAAITVIHQPIARMTAQLRDFIAEHDIERLLQLQRKNWVRKAYITAGLAGDGGWNCPVLMREFSMRNAPMMTAVAGQDCIAGMRVDRPFGGAYDASDVREANLDLAFQFPRLDMMGIAGDFGGISAFTATAKYQRSASSIVLGGSNHTRQETE
jgi:hypothetical protein